MELRELSFKFTHVKTLFLYVLFFVLTSVYVYYLFWGLGILVKNYYGSLTTDPSFIYLLSGVSFANFEGTIMFNHPGTPLTALEAILLKVFEIIDPVSFNTNPAAIFRNPDTYIHALNISIQFFSLIALVIASITAWYRWSRLAGLLILATPMWSLPLLMRSSFVLGAETLLVALSYSIICLWIEYLHQSNKQLILLLLSFTCGLLLATKITAFPMLIPSLFILKGWDSRKKYVVWTGISFIIGIIPLFFEPLKFRGFIAWSVRNISRSGLYGAGSSSYIDSTAAIQFLKDLVVNQLFFISILILSLTTVLLYFYREKLSVKIKEVKSVTQIFNKFDTSTNKEAKLLLGVLTAIIIQIIILLKQPLPHYLVPVSTLSGLSLALCIRLWKRFSLPQNFANILSVLFLCIGLSTSAYYFKNLVEIRENYESEEKEIFNLTQERGNCARIFYYGASHPAQALQWGGQPWIKNYAADLTNLFPRIYFYDLWALPNERYIYNWFGHEITIQQLQQQYPCVLLQGRRLGWEPRIEPDLNVLSIFVGQTEGLYLVK